MKSFSRTLPLAIVGCTLSVAHGAILAEWDSDTITTTTTTSFDASFTAPGLSTATTIMVPGSGSVPISGVGRKKTFGFRADRQVGATNAIAQGHFFNVHVQVDEGSFLRLDQLDLGMFSPDFSFMAGKAFSTVSVFASADGFASAPLASDAIATSTVLPGQQFFPDGIALDGGIFDGTEKTIDFRVYAYGLVDGSGKTSNRLFVRNTDETNAIVISGTVVPELSSVLPLSLLLGFCIIGRRKKTQA